MIPSGTTNEMLFARVDFGYEAVEKAIDAVCLALEHKSKGKGKVVLFYEYVELEDPVFSCCYVFNCFG